MDDIYEVTLNSLKSSGLIKYFSSGAGLPAPDATKLIELSKNAKKIFVEENNLCYKDESGEIICCPHIDSDVSDAGYWLSDKIPPPSFDITQGGNVRKADEAEAFYICIIVSAILDDEIFTNELSELVKSYDFDKMISNDDISTFRKLLEEWQELQSIIINVIVSAAKYSIADVKKEEEIFLKSGLPDIARDALRDLALNIKSVNFQYSTGRLSPEAIKSLTKIEILTLIEERNAIINKMIMSSKYGDLYKTLNLSTEYVNPIIKKKILNFCINEVEQLYHHDPSLEEKFGDINSVVSKVKRRALKLAVNSLIRENVLKFINDPDSYTLPRKG